MKALVTGASGFVGAAVARALVAGGHDVRVLLRGTSPTANIEGLDVTRIVGDVERPADCVRAVAGCDVVFHVAARYALWDAEPRATYRANVGGTHNVLRAALDAGVAKVVYTSTVGAIGLPMDGSPGDERTPRPRRGASGHYKRSKVMAERVALAFHADYGLPVVVVNPSAPMGERDLKPTPTGKIIVDMLNGRMPAYLDTGLNVVDVADVATGHVLAAERGRPGERYVLGNEDLTLERILAAIASLAGMRAPRWRIPYGVALGVGLACEAFAIATRSPPPVPLAGVRMARKHMFFSAEKAFRELGLPRTAPRVTLAKAIDWFARHGYVQDPVHARALIDRVAPVLAGHRG